MAKEDKKGMQKRKVEMPVHNGVQYMSIGGLFQDVAGDFTAQNQFKGQLAPTASSDYGATINQSGQNALAGYGNFQQNQMQQQQLASALQGVQNGTGPNPAQAMLNQSTGQNVANQSALMAGQRGANANAGLLARQASMAGTNAQQQAAGQAANMQAQQSLNAMGQQSQLLGQMGSQNIGEQQANTGLFGQASGAQNSQNMNNINNYSMVQGINSQVSQNNANAVNKTTGGMLNTLGGGSMVSSFAKGGQVPEHLQHIQSIYHGNKKLDQVPQMDRYADGGVIQVPNLMAGITNNYYGQEDKKKDEAAPGAGAETAGDMGEGAGAAVGADAGAGAAAGEAAGAEAGIMSALAKGGQVPGYSGGGSIADLLPLLALLAKGGQVQPTSTATSTATSTSTLTADQKKAKEQKLKDVMNPESTADIGYASGGVAKDFKGVQGKIGNWATDGQTSLQMDAQKYQNNPKTPNIEGALPGDVKGKQVAAEDYRSGGAVAGNAKVAGDSYKNDTQPAMLSPKEIVLPRSVTLAPDAPEKAKEFVAALLKKQGHGNSNQHKEFHKALKAAVLSRKKKSGE